MAQRIIATCGGLALDPSPLVTAAQGGMRVADNIIIDRPGVARQRPGFNSGQTQTTTRRPRRMHAYRGLYPIINEWDEGSDWAMRWIASGSPITVPAGGAQPINQFVSFCQFVEARKNLYWTSQIGLVKATDQAATAATLAGLIEPGTGRLASGAGSVPGLPANSARAYRWVYVRNDANGVLRRSPPSQWQKHINATGSPVSVSVTVPFSNVMQAGDVIELYASVSVPSTDVPADMMYLVKRVGPLTSVAAGTTVIDDDVGDDDLGQELYTNPTREGVLKANSPPPAAYAAARWSDCVWLGGTVGPYISVMQLRQVAGYLPSGATPGFRAQQDITTIVTNGSNVITNVNATVAASLRPGMLVTGSASPDVTSTSRLPANTRVVSVAGTSVTVSNAATASSGAGTMYFYDSIAFSGLPGAYPSVEIFAFNSTSNGLPGGTVSVNVSSANALTTARELAYLVNFGVTGFFGLLASVVEDPYDVGVATIVFRSRDIAIPKWSVTTTRPEAFSFDVDSSGAILVDRDDAPNRIAYSKPNEPESFPILNFLTVGSETEPVMALVPLRGALIVFKRDGVYRITGSAPDNWRVDVLDTRARPLRAECVTSLGEQAVVWSQMGVLLVDESGVQNISDGLVDDVLSQYQADAVENSEVESRTSYYACALNERGLLLVSANPDVGARASDGIYCWSSLTGAWTRWALDTYCALEAPGLAKVYVAESGSWRVRDTNDPGLGQTYLGYDAAFALSGWSYNSTAPSVTVTALARGLWEPKAGDWVSGGVGANIEYRRIVSVAPSGGDRICTLASAFTGTPSSSRVGYESIVSRMQWQGLTPETPAMDALWQELQVQYDWSRWTPVSDLTTGAMAIGASANRAALATLDWSAELYAAPSDDARVTIPRELARCAHLYPYVEIAGIRLDWRILGVASVLEVASERTRR